MRLETDDQISELVRAALAENGMSASEMARRIGVTQPYMARRLGGDVPWRINELTAVADALGVPLAKFLPASVSAA